MTRINIVHPSELTDQHLIAEYREITMVPGSLKRTLVSKVGYQESKVPERYTLNSGHVYFFYNKGRYLHRRYDELIKEMKLRGFMPSDDRVFPHAIFKDNDSIGLKKPHPALFIKNEISLCCLISYSILFKPSSHSKSATQGIHFPPVAVISSLTFFILSIDLPTMIISYPFMLNNLAIALPNPLDAPVTMAFVKMIIQRLLLLHLKRFLFQTIQSVFH